MGYYAVVSDGSQTKLEFLMRISLSIKFLLGYIIFGIASFIAISTISSRMTYDYLIRVRSNTLYDEASMIASTFSASQNRTAEDLSDAYNQLSVVAKYLNSQIWIMDRNGTIIADSEDVRTGDVIDDFDPTATGTSSYSTGNYFGSFPYEVLSVTAPIIGTFQTDGYIVIHLPMTQVQETQDEILEIVFLTFLIVFVLSLSLIIIYHVAVLRPLRIITNGAREYAAGHLDYRIDLKSHDEMRYLADTMNFMSDALYRTEEQQKKFIANISHDLRSPLTSIKGYLEAILDGTIPDEMQEKYLHRVIDETERLTNLTQNVIKLSSLDMKATLERSIFDINQVIKDTCASFEVQCIDKKIVFNLTFEGSSSMVYADLAKIQQVLYNLIDNAIKFSKRRSAISISTTHRRDKVFISVKDTGIGIGNSDQRRIFNRFYKSDSSRGKDKKGTGLGLSIVKEIVLAHDENIDVISTLGVGSEFIFSLPAASDDLI